MERKLTLEFIVDYETKEFNLNVNREGFKHFEKEELIQFLDALTLRMKNGKVNWIEKSIV